LSVVSVKIIHFLVEEESIEKVKITTILRWKTQLNGTVFDI